MKKTVTVILILAVVLFGLSMLKNVIAQAALSGGVKAITGLTLQMRSLDVGILRTLIGVKGVRLFNPSGFPDRVMVEMPELYVDYDLPAFFKGKVHLEEVRLDLKELTVVKNEKGVLNLDSLKAVQAGKEKKTAFGQQKGKAPQVQIDRLHLKVGKVVYKDYSGGTPPQVNEFNVNIDEKYENISNPYVLGSLILSRALFKTTIARLANFDIKALEGQLGDVGAALKKYSGGMTQTLGKTVGSTKELGEGAVDSTKAAVQETADTLKKLFR